jgi:hypothetical protein
MIKNQPSHTDFENVSQQCLTQALNLIFKIYHDYAEYDEIVKEEVSLEETWSYNSGTFRTSLILLHQGIETFMKAIVCKTSPLLLIEKNRVDWPTLPSRSDKDFDTLYTISGEALLTTFCAVDSTISINRDLVQFIEDVRQKRNRAIHGANDVVLTAAELFERILKAFTIFWGKDAWFKACKNFNLQNPLFGYFDSDFEGAITYEYLDMALDLLGRKRLSKYLNVNILGREYFCPECKKNIENEGDNLESKWAFLKPNKPESTIIHCVNCNSEFNVIRQNCVEDKCEGNVIHENDGEFICLTCFNYQ